MFTRSVDPLERFFMKQTDHIMARRNLLHNLHSELIVVYGNVGGRKNRRELVLGRGNFVMLCLGENSIRPKRSVQVLHKFGNSGLQNAEIMIFQLLSPRRIRPEKRPSRQKEIFALFIDIFIHKKIFLLGSHRRGNFFAIDPEEL